MDYISVGALAVWNHPAVGSPKGRVFLVHGICEHSGRHLNTVQALTQSGFEVVRFDLRGSGHSGGRRQYIDRFSDYCDDTLTVFNWIRTHLAPLPLFLMGHSLGGAIAIHTVTPIQQFLRGLILSAPAFITGSAISPLRIALGRLINRVLPTFQISSGSDRDCISRNPQVVTEYYNDPLSSHFNTVRQGDAVLRALTEVPYLVPGIHLPVLIVHGSHDRLIRLEGSYEIFRRIGSRSRTMQIIPGGYHELHNDTDKKEYFRLLDFWLTQQMTKPETSTSSEISTGAHRTLSQ